MIFKTIIIDVFTACYLLYFFIFFISQKNTKFKSE